MTDDYGVMPGPRNFRRLAEAADFRAWRKSLKLSQTEAGRRLGDLSLRAVQFYEKGERPISEIVRRRMQDLAEKERDVVCQPMAAALAAERALVRALDTQPTISGHAADCTCAACDPARLGFRLPITGPEKMMVKFSVCGPEGWRNFERECPPEVLAEASRRRDGITWLGRQLDDARFAEVTAMVWEPGT